jgi:hypothetical protein
MASAYPSVLIPTNSREATKTTNGSAIAKPTTFGAEFNEVGNSAVGVV